MVWLHNEKEIKPTKDFVYTNSGNKHFLEIPEIFPEDAGTYTCEAFNDVGECFSACTLVVEVRLTFDHISDIYREAQLNLTPEVDVFYMLLDRSLSIFSMASLKQHMKYQLDLPVV